MATASECMDDHKKLVILGTTSVVVAICLYSYSWLLFSVWVALIGAIIAYTGLSEDVVFPNLILNLHRVKVSDTRASAYPDRKFSQSNSCTVCESKDCSEVHKHTADITSLHPWAGLNIPNKVDIAIDQFFTIIFDRFVYSWYSEISNEEAPVDELKFSLRVLVAQLIKRLQKVSISEVVTKKIIPEVIGHLVQVVQAQRRAGGIHCDESTLLAALPIDKLYSSLKTREDELLYIKKVVQALFPHVLPKDVQQNRGLSILMEQILGGLILFPVLDKLADPDILNNVLLLLLDDTDPPDNPDPPSELVEILHHFTVPNSSCYTFPSHDLGHVIENQLLLVSFMDFMKQQGAIHYLQFFLALDNFNKDLLKPDLNQSDFVKLHKEAVNIYQLFCQPYATEYIEMDPCIAQRFKSLSEGEPGDVAQLRIHGDFLSRAYDYIYSLLDSFYLPKFRHSPQYFSYWYGSRKASMDRKGLRSSKGEHGSFKSIQNRFRGVFKGDKHKEFKDIDSDSQSLPGTPDAVSLQDEDVNESAIDELHDLSKWRVDLPSISIQIDQNAKKPTYYFQVKVYKNVLEDDTDYRKNACSVYRRYNDFYSLEQKLKQFHGDKLLVQLPSKKLFTTKDHEYLDSLKPKFEKFIQVLLQFSGLKNSELLYNFLTAEDFSKCSIPEIRLEKVLKSVPRKLVKEKGQNLTGFLKTFHLSTVASKARPDWTKEEKRAEDVESLAHQHLSNSLYRKCEPPQANGYTTTTTDSQINVTGTPVALYGVFDCIQFVAEEVYQVPKFCHIAIMALRMVAKESIDYIIRWYIGYKLTTVCEEHRLEALINLLKDILFFAQDPPRTEAQKAERRENALLELKTAIPGIIQSAIGKERFISSTEDIFQALQWPQLNKRLVYNLLDIVLLELVPSLQTEET